MIGSDKKIILYFIFLAFMVTITRNYESYLKQNVTVAHKFEASIINHVGRRGMYGKKEKWLPFKIQVKLTLCFMCIY